MSETKRALNCIVCPMSCSGTVTMEDGKITNLEGFTCPRGKAYAQEELTAPKRMLTTTVRVEGGALALLPVMSKASLPKGKIMDCAACLRSVKLQAPVKEGQVVNKGQKIAEMGNSDADQVKLHFEIRRFGKPVDPQKYLGNAP